MKTLSVDFGGKEFFAAGNGHIAAVVVRMIAAIATHDPELENSTERKGE
jgi:hypothetical protein